MKDLNRFPVRFATFAIASVIGLATMLVSADTAFASPVPGERTVVHDVALRHDTDVHTVTLAGHETTSIRLAGDGDSDLDLYVFDENGNEVCNGTGISDREVCNVRPRWTGPFRIEVRNLGSRANAYSVRLG